MTEFKFYPYFLFAICFFGVTLGAMNSVLGPSYLPDILKELNGASISSGNAGAWINFSFLAGGTIGGICFGFISDHIGRRKTLVYALLFCGIGSGLGAICSSWFLLTLTRFMVGIGTGTMLVVSVVILTEEWKTRTNAIALGILSIAYPVGIIVSGLITSNVSDWRTAFMIGLCPILLIIPTLFYVHETLKSEAKDAEEKKYSFSGYKNSILSGIVIYGTMLIGLWSAFAWLPTWVETLVVDLSTGGQTERGMAVTFLGIGGLIGGIISGWLAEYFGTRYVQAACFIICFLLSLFLFKMTHVFSDLVLMGTGLLGFIFGLSQGVLNILIPGMFPQQLRSSATGLCFHVGRVFTAIAVFFAGAWAIQLGGYGNAIFIFSGVYVLGLVALVMMKMNTYATH